MKWKALILIAILNFSSQVCCAEPAHHHPSAHHHPEAHHQTHSGEHHALAGGSAHHAQTEETAHHAQIDEHASSHPHTDEHAHHAHAGEHTHHAHTHGHHHAAHKKSKKHHPPGHHVPNHQSVSNNIVEPTHTVGFVSHIKQGLVQFIKNTVATLTYSVYKLGGRHFDPQNGIYVIDCSGYVDDTLRAANPDAYLSLVNSTGNDKPNSLNYYSFFKELSQQSNAYWSKVDYMEDLQAGDIVVFRNKKMRRNANGHVMVVMNKPIRYGNIYMLSVADSAPKGHSHDTRLPHVSGIGIGTLLLRTNPETGEPSAYAWKVGAPWKGNVNFAMARPIEHQINDITNNFYHWRG